MPPIRPRAGGEPAPLSFAQERLWFLEQLERESAAYNICRASRLSGNLTFPALEASLNEIVSRHETLRTSFRLIDGKPVQVVRQAERISIDFVELRSVRDSERAATIQREIEAEALRPFNLESGALLRCALLRVHEQEHILVLMTHHSAADAWSMGTLTRELWTFYDAFSNDRPCLLEPLPVQYSDYAVWQREWLQGDVLESQLGYWKDRLKDLSILNLPPDRPRKPRQSFQGARLTIELPDELTSAVNEMSHRFAVTPFMILLAVFQVLLYRYTGQEDVVVGSPIANRRRPEVERLIGFFVNTLVLRADLSGKPSFTELLFHVRDVCVGANANQDLPFEKLVQELQPERDQSRNPLFQVMFVLQNATRPFTGISGLRIEPLEVARTRSPFDLSLFLRERDGKYVGYIEYSTDLFDHDRIERMAGHFQTLLEAIVKAPDQPIATLPILTEAERHRILVEWNDTAADYPKDKCIHQLFEEQVERTPEAIAVEFENQQISYRELNRRANQLAHYLISLGIGPEKLVGIFFERSVEMIVGLLGILKARGAYVPLDQNYPKARLQFMVEDARTTVILNHDSLAQGGQLSRISSLANGSGPKVICLASEQDAIVQQSRENPDNLSSSTNLAYVLYTSGSTGQPKGVEIEHRSVVNCLQAIHRLFEVTKNDALLAVTTISFDIATLELYLPLITGAKIILGSRDDVLDGKQLADKLESSAATIMQATPSTWRLLNDAGWRPRETFTILCGGEALSRRLADQLLDGGVDVWNLYGPTETTIWSTMAKVEPGEGPVLIGRPIANTAIYILDAYLHPVPLGGYGELCIGGDGLARGYLNQPQLTAEKFIPNPFSDQTGSRLYRTGDLARYRPDGNIEFLGRCDNQVKIRGHRVELGEIETVLNRHPSVKEAVVVPHVRDSSDEKVLAAYVVGSHEPSPTVGQLRGFLQERVPQFMIPSVFIFLYALPLTPNGKIDRDALAAIDGEPTTVDHEFVEPRTGIEQLVVQIWREVLKRDKISIYDNFFELGGHSILAIQVITRLRQACNMPIPLGLLFDAPILASLARKITRFRTQRDEHQLPPLISIPRNVQLPVSVNQHQLWKICQAIPNNPLFNMPYVFRIVGDLNVGALKKAISEIVKRHEAFRTVFRHVGGQLTQIIQQPPDSLLPVIDLHSLGQHEASQKAAHLILNERNEPFSLDETPLFRATLLRLTQLHYFFLLTVHHVVSDDWSMRIFQQELAALYEAFANGRASPLTDVPFHLADYAAWEQQAINRGLFATHLKYWRKQLSIGLHRRESENDKSGETSHSHFRPAVEQLEFDGRFLASLNEFALRKASTSFTVFVTALSITLHLLTGERDIRIGIVTANRASKDREGIIGNLANTIIFRIQVEPNLTTEKFLSRVRNRLLADLAHQEMPFEYMVQTLGEDRRENYCTSFAIQLIYQTTASQQPEFPGLTFAPFPVRALGALPEFVLSNVGFIFHIRSLSTKLTTSLTYRANSTNKARAKRLTETVKAVLMQMIGGVSVKISSLSAHNT